MIAHQLELAAGFIFRATWQAALVIVLLLLLRAVVRNRISPRWWCVLWLAAGAKFIVPAAFSVTSLPTWPGPESAQLTAAPIAPAKSANPTGVFTRITFFTPSTNASISPGIQRPPINWTLWLATLWLAGAMLLVTRRILREISLTRQIKQMLRVDEPRIASILAGCAQELGIRRRIDIVETSRVRAPAVWGIRRPVVFLPTGFARSASDVDIRLVVLHELIHVARGDLLLDRLIHFLRDLHWFNPFAWLWLRMYCADRELACDRAVLAHLRESERESYGQCLLRMIERISALSRTAPASIGLFHSKSNITRRVTMISTFAAPRSRVWNIVPVSALLLVGCATLTSPSQPSSKPSGSQQAGLPATSYTDFTPYEQPQPRSAQDQALAATLEQKLPEIDFNAIPLDSGLDWFREKTGANIFVNWRALEAAGVDRNTPITARLRDIKFSKALSVILADAGGGTVKLGFTTDDGVITVSTYDELHKNTITRVYDVRDLLVEVPDFAPPTRSRSEPATQPKLVDSLRALESNKARLEPDTQPTRQQLVDRLISLIEQTVDPDSWRGAGGNIGAIQELSGQLIITQIPENQQQVAALLNNLRDSRAVQVIVDARFLTLSTSSWPRELKDKLGPVLKDKSAAFLDAEEADALIRRAGASIQSTLIAAPRITLFNGQRAYVRVGNTTAYISDFVAVKAAGGETRFEPQTTILDTGVLFDVTATASADRSAITLSLNPKITKLIELRPEKWAGAADMNLTVQKPLLSIEEAATTVTVPDRKVVVLAASPPSGKAATTQPDEIPSTDGRLFVFVKPTLIIQREVEAAPPLKSAARR